MKIISIKNYFESDHSSTTYYFYTKNKFTKKEREYIKKLTGSNKALRKLPLRYEDDDDIPLELEDELMRYYEIVVRESYDWWSGELLFDYTIELYNKLKKYEGYNEDGLGVHVTQYKNKIVVKICFVMNYNSSVLDKFGSNLFNGLCILFSNIRDEILNNDFSALQTVCKFYCSESQLPIEVEDRKSESAEIIRRLLLSFY